MPHHQAFPRSCLASSSRLPARSLTRRISIFPPRLYEPVPFFTPPFRPLRPVIPEAGGTAVDKGKGKDPGSPKWKGEEEVDDREWEIRVGELLR